MKNFIKFALIALVSTLPTLVNAQDLQKKVEELEARLDDMEIQNSLNSIRWSGTLINRFENFTNKRGDPGSVEIDTIKAFSTALSLNMDAQLNDKTAAYVSVGMSKFWNNDGRDESTSYWTRSQSGSYTYSGSIPVVDRAYMTYKFDMPMTFAIGRMATSMGQPMEQLDGLDRTGTYPRFAYNAIFDGAALVYNFNDLMPAKQKLTMRLFYTPFVNIDQNKRTEQWQEGGTNGVGGTGKKIHPYNDQFTLLTEYSIEDTFLAKKVYLTHFFYDYQRFYWVGQNNTLNSDGSYLNGRANLGFIGLDGVANTGLNFSHTHLNVYSGGFGADYVNSNASLTNINYKFASLNDLVAGMEYIVTDKYFYLDEWNALNLIPFYQTPSNTGMHFFVSKPLAKGIIGRAGFYQMDVAKNSYYNTKAMDLQSGYVQLRTDF